MRDWLSLRERLVVVVLAALLPFFALALWAAVRETDEAVRRAQAQLQTTASLLAASHDQAIEAAEQLLGAIAANPQLALGGREGCQSYFERLRDRYAGYSNIGLLAPDGEVLCHARGASGSGNASDRTYFREALERRRFVMGDPIQGRVTGRTSLPFAAPVVEDGHVRAVVFATLDLEQASAALARTPLPADAQAQVLDRRGQVLIRSRPAGAKFADAGDLLTARAAGRAVGDHRFVVQVEQPRRAATLGAWEEMREMLPTLGFGLLLALAVTAWLGGEMIVRPARQLLGSVRRLERGRLDVRVPLASRHARGEFARIAAAFNLMADSLQVRQSDLQQELARSRDAYNLLDVVLNSLHEGIVAVTANGQFLLHNEAAAQLLPLEDAPRLPELWAEHFGFFHLDGSTRYTTDELPMVRSALGDAAEVQLIVRNAVVPEGRRVQCSWRPISEGRGVRGGVIVLTDVTELQRLQAAQAMQVRELHDTQVKLVEAQRLARIGHWELDLQTGRLLWSDEIHELFGVPQEGFDGSPRAFTERVHPEDRPRLKPAREATLREGVPLDQEYRVIRPDGTLLWIHETGGARRNERGEPVWFGGLVQDITSRKRTEEERARLFSHIRDLNATLEERIAQRTTELSRQEQLYRTLAEQAPEVVWNTDTEGKVTFLNRAWHELVGGEPSQWLGTGWVDRVHPDDRGAMIDNWKRSSAALQPYAGTRRILSRQGVYHTMAYRAAPVLDDEGRVSFWVGIDSDITGLKGIERALRQSNQELEAFSYSVSHDLRAPLGAIGGFSRALSNKLEGQLDDKAAHYLARIQAGVDKMEQLIDGMLSLARVVRVPLNVQEVDLSAIARETLEGLSMQHGERKVEACVADGLQVSGDARLLRGVMENLLGNAWKFSSRSPQARIEVGRLPDDGAFFVRDNGVGFDMAYADKLFGAFQRLHTEAEFPGTGVGLATVQRIVARHGGRIWVESAPGEGTTFYFTLG